MHLQQVTISLQTAYNGLLYGICSLHLLWLPFLCRLRKDPTLALPHTYTSCVTVLINDPDDHTVLIEGVLFRARYLGSTQLISDGHPSKSMRMMQAQEAVGRIKVGRCCHLGSFRQTSLWWYPQVDRKCIVGFFIVNTVLFYTLTNI